MLLVAYAYSGNDMVGGISLGDTLSEYFRLTQLVELRPPHTSEMLTHHTQHNVQLLTQLLSCALYCRQSEHLLIDLYQRRL
jgi:hypothetical protein